MDLESGIKVWLHKYKVKGRKSILFWNNMNFFVLLREVNWSRKYHFCICPTLISTVIFEFEPEIKLQSYEKQTTSVKKRFNEHSCIFAQIFEIK